MSLQKGVVLVKPSLEGDTFISQLRPLILESISLFRLPETAFDCHYPRVFHCECSTIPLHDLDHSWDWESAFEPKLPAAKLEACVEDPPLDRCAGQRGFGFHPGLH